MNRGPMYRRLSTVGIIALLMVGGVAMTLHHRDASAAAGRRADATRLVAEERRARDAELAFYLEVASEDSLSAMASAKAAALHLQVAHETGSYPDILDAETQARRSIALLPGPDEPALSLTASLVGQHRFDEARTVANALRAHRPDDPALQALVGEILLELGDYEGASSLFDSVTKKPLTLGIAPRVARWHELTGRTARARDVMRAAGEQALQLDHLRRAQVAWYYLRMGDLEWRDGRVERAEAAYTEGLDLVPDDHRLTAALARLMAARGKWRDAIDYAEASIATVLDPGPLAVLGDAHQALGDTARANEYYSVLEVAFMSQPGPFHRAMSLHLLDRGRHTATVLAKAQEEITVRRDPYGYDVLAWALHANGRSAEARAAIGRALGFGTVEATFFYHAGMIERALGDTAAARRHLERALEVNRYFHPAHPATARAVLDSLDDASR